jgi:hypothetical protein
MIHIHKRVEGATYQILKLQNRSIAIFINSFESLMMTTAGRNTWCDVEELLNKF